LLLQRIEFQLLGFPSCSPLLNIWLSRIQANKENRKLTVMKMLQFI
jgi:hypothetical protein